MASTNKEILLSPTALAAVVADAVGVVQKLQHFSKDLVAEILVTDYVDGDITAIVQHSFDNVNWYTLVAFTASLAANTAEIKNITNPSGKYVRVKYTTTIGGGAAVNLKAAVNLWYKNS